MLKQTDVTIIIPHLGAEATQCYALQKCYKSLKDTFTGEIIVVKNGNKGCLCDRDMRIIEQGQCKAVNAAAAIVSTPWIMVTNDDMIYPANWFEDLTNFALLGSSELSIKCISPLIVEPHPGAPTFETYFCGGAGGDFDQEKFEEYAKNRPIPVVPRIRTGFNLPFLIRKDVWDVVGGYDVNFDPWGSNSDSDLEYKLKLAGVQPYQNTAAVVYHFSQTSGTFEPKNQSYWGQNWEYFIKKWGFPRTDKRIWEADFEIPGTKEGRIFSPWWQGFFS